MVYLTTLKDSSSFLFSTVGNTNGTAAGKRYFRCEPNRGKFIRLEEIEKVLETQVCKQRGYSLIASSVLRVNCYPRGFCVGSPSAFNFPIWTWESFTQHQPTRQSSLSFIDIVLKLGAQLSILIAIFQVFGIYDSAVFRTHNLPFWWRALYLYTTSRCVSAFFYLSLNISHE